jgi:hypothetical protein
MSKHRPVGRVSTALFLTFLMLPLPSGSAWPSGADLYQYVSPAPGARLVSPWNNIILRHGSIIDASTVDPEALSVVGALSGRHAGEWVLSDDSKTLVFKPATKFSSGESVQVNLGHGVKTLAGEGLQPLTFSFSVTTMDPKLQRASSLDRLFRDEFFWQGPRAETPPSLSAGTGAGEGDTSNPCEALPATYPPITLLQSRNPDPGNVFIAPFQGGSSNLVILDNLDEPLFYRQIQNPLAADFKLQPNGLLTYFNWAPAEFRALDSSYAIVDTYATGNGYSTDVHGLQVLPNGHALLMSYDPQPVDMSAVVPGGNPNATVTGLIIQELDAAKNVIFQWRSWDHFEITDAVNVDLTAPTIDYSHGNSVELDFDGNILISSRHMSEITKIDRQTGDIIWRLGLNAPKNEFTFVNDTRGFSYQHDARRLPNGNITVFDNGNFQNPGFSRAVEYELDEQNKVATLVWQYRNTPDVRGPFMGNVQRRSSGGTMIGWGGADPTRKVTDIHADGTKAYELGMTAGWWTYRAFRFPWQTTLFETDKESLEFGRVTVGDTGTVSLLIENNADREVPITCFVSTDPAFSVTAAVPVAIPELSAVTVEVQFNPDVAGDFSGNLYIRSATDTEIIAQVVTVSGIARDPGLQLPGDCNHDAALDLSDAVCTLGVLFNGNPPLFPCGDGSPTDPGNIALIDWQPDGALDLSDIVAMLQFLFFSQAAHPLATPGAETLECVPIAGCDDNAACP